MDDVMKMGTISKIAMDDDGDISHMGAINYSDLTGSFKDIATGTFGKIFTARYFGTTVAVKKLFNIDDPKMKKYIRREYAALKEINHPNIVQFMGLCSHESGLYLVTEFLTGGDLTTLIDDPNVTLSWERIIDISNDVSTAMAFLHGKGIMHRDLKTQNLLLNEWGKIKICDLGLARKAATGSGAGKKGLAMTMCGTDDYMAPEVLLGDPYDYSADVFSFGMVMYELITRLVPPERHLKDHFRFDVEEFYDSCPPDVPPLLSELVVSCCETNPKSRPTFMQLLNILDKLKQKFSQPKSSKSRDSSRNRNRLWTNPKNQRSGLQTKGTIKAIAKEESKRKSIRIVDDIAKHLGTQSSSSDITDTDRLQSMTGSELIDACEQKDIKRVQNLLQNFGSTILSDVNSNLETPLLISLRNADLTVASLLLLETPPGSVDVTIKDDSGKTPMWWIGFHSALLPPLATRLLSKELLKRGSDPCCEAEGTTSIELALKNGRKELAELIEKYSKSETQ